MIPKSWRWQASMSTYIGLCTGKDSVHVHDIVSREVVCQNEQHTSHFDTPCEHSENECSSSIPHSEQYGTAIS